MRTLLLWLVFILLLPYSSTAQENNIFKGLYEDFLKYGTIYGAGDISNSVETREPVYFVRTNPNGSIYDVPEVVDVTPDFPFDYRIGFGIRKLGEVSILKTIDILLSIQVNTI